MFRKSAGYFTLIGDKAARNSSEVARSEVALNVVILTLETVGTFGVWVVAYSCRQDLPSRMKPWMLPGSRHRGPTTMRTLFP